MKALWKSAALSAALAALFLLVYGLCNWLTSLRPHVPSLYMPWERSLPFIPLLILPYMSIDLFFIAAPFLTRAARERRTLARRITAAILSAGVCFLLMPLRFGFDRPPVAGFLGGIFNHFRTLDLPFNEFPSLHVALALILLDTYHRHTRGGLRVALHLWFALILVSPVLTYQHHLIGILGGLVLGVVCLHFLQDAPLRQPFAPNRRVGVYYAAGAVLLALVSLSFMPWSLLLLYPAGALAIIAAAYLWLGPGVYRKHHGRLPWTTRVLLAPILLGQRISLSYYARHCRPFDPLTANVYIGRVLASAEARELRARGVGAVIDLAVEFSESPPLRLLPYLHLPVLDLAAPTPEQIAQALAFIEHHAPRAPVYLHCKIGYSRTAAIAGAYLLATGRVITAAEAIALLLQARPGMTIRPESRAVLAAQATAYASAKTIGAL